MRMGTFALVVGGIVAVNIIGTAILIMIYIRDERRWQREHGGKVEGNTRNGRQI